MAASSVHTGNLLTKMFKNTSTMPETLTIASTAYEALRKKGWALAMRT